MIKASVSKNVKIKSSQNFTMLKRISFLFSILILIGQLSAQDTITVQTITRDNDARAGTYTFPSGEQSFEKILMIYNMRCKDNIVNQTGGNTLSADFLEMNFLIHHKLPILIINMNSTM